MILDQLIAEYAQALGSLNNLKGRTLRKAREQAFSLSDRIRWQDPGFDFPALWRDLGIPPIPDTPPQRRLFDDYYRKHAAKRVKSGS